MARYKKDVQPWVRANFGFVPETCWIADVKAAHGLTTRQAANRINPDTRERPCPPTTRAAIEVALRHFSEI